MRSTMPACSRLRRRRRALSTSCLASRLRPLASSCRRLSSLAGSTSCKGPRSGGAAAGGATVGGGTGSGLGGVEEGAGRWVWPRPPGRGGGAGAVSSSGDCVVAAASWLTGCGGGSCTVVCGTDTGSGGDTGAGAATGFTGGGAALATGVLRRGQDRKSVV